MKSIFKIIPLLLLLLVNRESLAQQSIDGFYAGYQYYEEVVNPSEILFLSYLEENPVDLNSASISQLIEIPGIDDSVATSIIYFREVYQDFTDVKQLLAVKGMNEDRFNKISRFVQVKNAIPESNRRSGMHYLLLRAATIFPLHEGFFHQGEKSFQGGRWHRLIKYRNQVSGSIDFGFTAENDIGEKVSFAPSNQKYGTDFLSAFVKMLGVIGIDEVIIGDYRIHNGQGLILGDNRWYGKAMNPVRMFVPRKSYLRQSTSSFETPMFRGIAGRKEFGKFNLLLFFSMRNMDANRNEHGEITSILESGLHRSEFEGSKRNVISQQSVGATLAYEHKGLRITLAHLTGKYSTRLNPDSTIYNANKFRGDKFVNTSLSANYKWSKAFVFGEFGAFNFGSLSYLVGSMGRLHELVEYSVVFRKYHSSFYSPFGDPFRENSVPANENGVFVGIRIQPAPGILLNLAHDIYKFPALKFGTYKTSDGNSTSADFQFRFRHNWKLRFRAQYGDDYENHSPSSGKLHEIIQENKITLLLSVQRELNDQLFIGGQLRQNGINSEHLQEKGYVALFDVNFKNKVKSVQLSSRVAYIQAPNYATRHFVYERGLLFDYNFDTYYGEAFRCFVSSKIKINKWVSFWLKGAVDIHKEEISKGQGADEKIGDRFYELRSQLILNFN